MQCNKCHWNKNKKPLKDCSFCARLEFSEDILCSITRSSFEEDDLLECGAYRPKLSLASSEQHNDRKPEKIESENYKLSDKEKWLIAYSKQQLQSNPDKFNFKLQFHVCLISKNRNVIFSSPTEQFEKLKNIFSQIANGLDNTQIEVLWVSTDHIHLYVNTIPDYAFDEIASKFISISEREIISIYPEIMNKSNFVWEIGYFVETIG